MSRPILIGLVALAVLCFLCIYCHAPAIETDLHDRARRALASNGFDTNALTVAGRDVTLTGTVTDDEARQQALSVLRGVEGIRVVNDASTVVQADGDDRNVDASGGAATAGAAKDGAAAIDGETPATTANEPTKAAPLTFTTGPNGIVLRGTVASDTVRAQLVAAARETWGDDQVTDRLAEVDASTTDDTPGRAGPDPNRSFTSLLRALHDLGLGLEATFGTDRDGPRLTVTGEVLSELARERTVGALGTALPGGEIVDRLTVRPPTSATETLQARLDAQMVGKLVEFETSSDQLTPRGQAVLDELATLLTATPGRVEISGHTDSRGNPDFNVDLSRRRALAARRYLVSKGLDNDRFTTVGHGASRPIANNETADGRQRNRRTEFRALEDE